MHDTSTVAWLENLGQDTRYGFRQLAKAPVLVTVAILSLALGIGANTAIFTLINAVMLQALPVRDPGRLVLFNDNISTGVYSGEGFGANEFSYPSWEYLKTHNDVFEDICAFRQGTDRLILHVSGSPGNGPREQTKVHLVSGNYFAVLGVRAAAGRIFQPSDDSPTAVRTAVISYPFWRDRFHLDPAIIGKTVVVSGTAFNIIGVAASEFFGERIETAPDFFLPLSAQQQVLDGESYLTARTVYWLNFIARLKPGVTLPMAQAAANVRLHEFYLEQAGTHPTAAVRRQIQEAQIHLKPGGAGISGTRYRYSKPLQVLMGVVAIVLLIACANIATLILARASARRQEFAARLALGASRARLLRQVLTENILLSLMGGAVGVGFAWWSVRLLVIFLHVSSVVKVRPDPAVLAFTFALSILTGVLFGIIPALKFSRMESRSKSLAKVSTLGKLRLGSSQVLIGLQVSLSLVLLLGAGLLAHSLLALEEQDLGFQRQNILVVRIDANLAGYQPAQFFPLYREIAERLSGLPAVTQASLTRYTPVNGYDSSGNFSMEDSTPAALEKLNVHEVEIAPHFFETLRIPLLLGRTIGPRDTSAAPAVVVVNQTFVNLYLPHQNPIGRHMMLGAPFKAPGAEIVGVVADSKFYDLRDKAQPMAFFSLWQKPAPAVDIVLRTAAAPSGITAEVRQALAQVSNKLPIMKVATLDSQIEHSLEQQKMITTLCGIFGVLALVLASVGIYGTLAYSVTGRTNEIGIRMAIGAQRHDVIWMVLGESLVLITAGIILGLPFALSGTRWLTSFLFGVQRVDPLAIGSAVSMILLMSLLAGYLPARRAAKIDPMRALRHE